MNDKNRVDRFMMRWSMTCLGVYVAWSIVVVVLAGVGVFGRSAAVWSILGPPLAVASVVFVVLFAQGIRDEHRHRKGMW